MGIKDRNISGCSTFLLISGLSYKVIWPASPIQPLHVPFFLRTRLFSKKNSICQGQLIPIACSQGVLSCGKKRPQLSWVKVGWCSNFVLLLSFCFTIYLGLEMYLGDVILLKWSFCQKNPKMSWQRTIFKNLKLLVSAVFNGTTFKKIAHEIALFWHLPNETFGPFMSKWHFPFQKWPKLEGNKV